MGARKYGGPTPKRHKIWSNDEYLVNDITAEASSMTREEMAKLPGAPLVKKYVDKSGQQRCTGVRTRLKASQSPGDHFIKNLIAYWLTYLSLYLH